MDNAPPATPADNRWLDAGWLLGFAALSTLWIVSAGQALGPTFDEPVYLEKGLEHWRTGSYHGLLRLGTMPLPIDVHTLPVYLYERYEGVVFDYARDMDRILPWARLGNLVFWYGLLFFARLIGRGVSGPWGGRLAVAFLAVEPSFLGHACLATTDIAVTATFLAFVYMFWRGRELGWWGRIAWPSLCFGLLLLSKASGMVFAPIAMLAIETYRLGQNGALQGFGPSNWAGRWRMLRDVYRPLTRDGLRIAGWGFLTAFVYCGSDWQPQASFLAWAQGLPDSNWRDAMVWLAETVRIFPNAAVGLMRQVKHNVQGHSCYLLGEEHNRALWYYFPALLTIKLSLPLLVLPAALACTRGRALINWAFLAFLALMLFSLSFRVQIGIRMVLPLVALGIVGLAGGLAQSAETWGPGMRRRVAAGLTCACLAWTAVDAARVWPHGLCFTNECFGSTNDGYVHVSDSNYDWGQGLKDLRAWQQHHPGAPLTVWYFGTDPAITRPEFDTISPQALQAPSPEQFLEQVRGKVVAVSTTRLYGSYSSGCETPRDLLRRLAPLDRTPTFLIYDFRDGARISAARPGER